ncbi:MAG: hypothetical protein ACI8X5_002974 [Planctomycetota bacterium]|jgi:hypothetical protein
MKLSYILLLAPLLVASCASTQLPAGNSIGEEVVSATIHHFSVIDADPAGFFNQTVLVEAEVIEVCRSAGCWMQISDEGKTAMVRWESGCGGAYAFPVDAIGKRVLIQGSFYPKELSDEDREHLKEEAGGELTIREDPYEFNASSMLIIDEQ